MLYLTHQLQLILFLKISSWVSFSFFMKPTTFSGYQLVGCWPEKARVKPHPNPPHKGGRKKASNEIQGLIKDGIHEMKRG